MAEREPLGLRIIAWFASGLIAEARRQAFLEAAYVAATIRDEYEAMGQNLANGVQTRQRYNRDATVARQIKGAILARGHIQEWPAPKPVGAGGERTSSDKSVATGPLSETALSGSESSSSSDQQPVRRRGFWLQLWFCWLLDRHENRRADAWGWRPLFPVVCDHCAELFYMDQRTDDEREALDKGTAFVTQRPPVGGAE